VGPAIAAVNQRVEIHILVPRAFEPQTSQTQLRRALAEVRVPQAQVVLCDFFSLRDFL
jgi:hypothetical protein